MRQLSLLILSVASVASFARAEFTFVNGFDVVARGCQPVKESNFFNPTTDQRCEFKTYCLNINVHCHMIMKSILEKYHDNWQEAVAKSSENISWVEADAGIFCKQQGNSCEKDFDFDKCANESPDEIQCSMQDLPGFPKMPTLPKRTKVSQ